MFRIGGSKNVCVVGKMKVFWSKKAQHAFHEQVVWYEGNRGHDFVISFAKNIEEHIATICEMPTVGRFIKEENKRLYRSIVCHPRCTIYYWHNDKEVHIANLKFVATR